MRERARRQRGPRAAGLVSDDDVLELATGPCGSRTTTRAKRGADTPMDIEWAKDGVSGELFIVQARPETVHSRRARRRSASTRSTGRGDGLVAGLAIGDGVASGKARVHPRSARDRREFQPGEILVTEIDRSRLGADHEDGRRHRDRARRAHVARGDRRARARHPGDRRREGARRSASRRRQRRSRSRAPRARVGRVYAGRARVQGAGDRRATLRAAAHQDHAQRRQPRAGASSLSLLPSDGVGLARMEFIFASWVGVHPLALTRYATLPRRRAARGRRVTRGYADKTTFFVDRLSQGIAHASRPRSTRGR